jgi:hypothetical protein
MTDLNDIERTYKDAIRDSANATAEAIVALMNLGKSSEQTIELIGKWGAEVARALLAESAR